MIHQTALSQRRLVTRYEEKVEKSLGFLHLGCILILLRQFWDHLNYWPAMTYGLRDTTALPPAPE